MLCIVNVNLLGNGGSKLSMVFVSGWLGNLGLEF